jgi:NO-binding membrane sensor protein with MHYT domain
MAAMILEGNICFSINLLTVSTSVSLPRSVIAFFFFTLIYPPVKYSFLRSPRERYVELERRAWITGIGYTPSSLLHFPAI